MKLILFLACMTLGMVGCAFPDAHSHHVTDIMATHGKVREGQTYRLTKDAMTDGVHLFAKDAELSNGTPIRAIGSTLNHRKHLLDAPEPVLAGTRLIIRQMVWEDVVTTSAFRVEFEVADGRHAGRRLSIFNGPEHFILGSFNEGTVRLNPEWFSLKD